MAVPTKETIKGYETRTGEHSVFWKGNAVGYHAFHSHIRRYYGRPPHCECCGTVGVKTGRRWSIEYALRPKHHYSREIADYEALCKSCHRKQDMTEVTRKKISEKAIKRGSAPAYKAWKTRRKNMLLI